MFFSDFFGSFESITIPAGSLRSTIRMEILDDDVRDGNVSFVINSINFHLTCASITSSSQCEFTISPDSQVTVGETERLVTILENDIRKYHFLQICCCSSVCISLAIRNCVYFYCL